MTILLIKNPAGANEILRTLTLESEQLDVLAVLNDKHRRRPRRSHGCGTPTSSY